MNAINEPASVTLSYDDEVAPAPTLNAPSANPAALTGTAGTALGDGSTVQVKVFSGGSATGTPAYTATGPVNAVAQTFSVPTKVPDGTWTAVATQSDDAHNAGTSAAQTFTVDTTPPAPAISVPQYVSTQRPTFTGTAGTATGDGTDIAVTVTATAGVSVTAHATPSSGMYTENWTTGLPAGTYTVFAQQKDVYGNTGQSATATFTVDLTAPAPTLTAPAAVTRSSTVTLTGTGGTAAGDDAAVLVDVKSGAGDVRTVSAPLSSATYSAAVSDLADGVYTATASQGDAAGHSTTASRSFRVDTTPPEIDTSAIAASYAQGTTIAASFSCSDTGGSGVAGCTGPTTIDTTAAGDHELTITATDNAGNTRTAHVDYTVLAPTATPTPTPTPTTAPVVIAATPTPNPSPSPTPPPARSASLTRSSAKASHRGKTVTLKLRGTASGTGAVKLSVTGLKGSGRTNTAKLVNGTWTATLHIHVAGRVPKKLKLTVSDASRAAHAVTRSLAIR